MPTGAHQLVAQNADGDVIGWTPIRIAASGSLASTGSSITGALAAFAGTLVLMAAGVVLVARRGRRA